MFRKFYSKETCYYGYETVLTKRYFYLSVDEVLLKTRKDGIGTDVCSTDQETTMASIEPPSTPPTSSPITSSHHV
ncbi:hypothetical protein GWI33_012570 [Rhynchophorus ferrugineus]|uniref:Uncharacterized protein n=1 Tax=Rhynchophorus ferrugineus TaxID=354439 RepID=A0A834I828_RHYFE|nr:hypothetical protein GWI33_012570 [Rhynchophorus ferrugineus]